MIQTTPRIERIVEQLCDEIMNQSVVDPEDNDDNLELGDIERTHDIGLMLEHFYQRLPVVVTENDLDAEETIRVASLLLHQCFGLDLDEAEETARESISFA